MTWSTIALSLASLLVGLACVPLLDPGSRRWLRARGRARRVKRLRRPTVTLTIGPAAQVLGVHSSKVAWLMADHGVDPGKTSNGDLAWTAAHVAMVRRAMMAPPASAPKVEARPRGPAMGVWLRD